LPKHKGTEKMQADLRRRLSQARRESQKKGGAHATPAYMIRLEGAGQVALIGPPNSGKSSLVRALTHARPEVGDYPFTTRMPTPGMMPVENIHIQLVDTPPVSPEFMEPWLGQVIRAADLSVLVVDPNDPAVLGEIEFTLETLERFHAAPPRMLLGNKIELADAVENLSAIAELYGGRFLIAGVSADAAIGLDAFAQATFRVLDVVRFYSKPPGRKADLDVPYVLRRGATVQDAAAHVHRDFGEHLKYARLFRRSHEHDGLMVERTHVVEDEDILEFHAH
ncbi:MAG: GTPase, partial [Bryobacteraceae bacterium]